MEHTFKVGDKVTCDCWEILKGKTFTISEITGNGTIFKLPGAVRGPGYSEWYNVGYIKLVESVKQVCKNCGQPVVEKNQLSFTGSNTILFHEVNGKLFRMCKNATKEAGNTTDYNEYLLAELNPAKQILNGNDLAEALGKHEPEPTLYPLCKYCKQPIRKIVQWEHIKEESIYCAMTFKATPENTVVVPVPANNLTVSQFAGRRKFRDE